MVFVCDLEDAVFVRIRDDVGKRAADRRVKTDQDGFRVLIDVGELQREEVARAPVGRERAGIDVFQRTCDSAVRN